VQIGPLEIVIVLIIALLIFGGRFGGMGKKVGGRLRRTKDAAVEAGQGLREGYEEEPAADSRITRATRKGRNQVEAAGRSIPDAARGAKDGYVEEGPATSRLGRAAESAGKKTRSGAETVAGTATSAGRELKAGLTGEAEEDADGRVGRGARAGGDYLRNVGKSLSETGAALREGLEGKDDPEEAEVVDEAPALAPPPSAPKPADAPEAQPVDAPAAGDENHRRPA
jgi:Sec-independent protein translocase protein TatA